MYIFNSFYFFVLVNVAYYGDQVSYYLLQYFPVLDVEMSLFKTIRLSFSEEKTVGLSHGINYVMAKIPVLPWLWCFLSATADRS